MFMRESDLCCVCYVPIRLCIGTLFHFYLFINICDRCTKRNECHCTRFAGKLCPKYQTNWWCIKMNQFLCDSIFTHIFLSVVNFVCRNLQAAVGCYLDYYSGMRLPSMQIISDVTIGEGESITPNTEYVLPLTPQRNCIFFLFFLLILFHDVLLCSFVQSWRVKNNGDEVWPYGCYIKCTSSENLPTTAVSPIEPGHCTVVSVKLCSAAELGSFQTKWRLFTSNGSCFGGKFFL